MSIRGIRDYFDTQIKEIDSDIQEWSKDVFGNNDITKPIADKYYNLTIGPTSLSRTGNAFTDSFDITLTLFSSSKRDIQTEFDNLYDKSINIRNNIICNISVVASTVGFSDIEGLSITPSEEDTNDNVLRFDMEFTARLDFKF